MKKLVIVLFFFVSFISVAQDEETDIEISDEEAAVLIQKYFDSISNSFTWEHGKVILKNGIATVNVPEGYKFLDGKQSKTVLEDLWGNPPTEEPLGMLFPEEVSPVSDNFTYAIEIDYNQDGYIKDDDAAKLDYDDLMKDMQKDVLAQNEERVKMGYDKVELIGWAAKPFYDQKNHKLHWAKEIKFADNETNTLNYDIRILGRKGYLNLNAIGEMDVLPQVQDDVDNILASVEFNEGHKYADFDPSFDKVAAYGIGGLIAGKALAKVGAFALLAKFWKFIAIGVVAAFGGLKKYFSGKKES